LLTEDAGLRCGYDDVRMSPHRLRVDSTSWSGSKRWGRPISCWWTGDYQGGFDGVVRIWNRGAEALFGFGAEEVLGGSLDRIIPERFWRAHWDGFSQALESGQIKYTGRTLTTRSVHKNGGELYVDLSLSLVRDHAGFVMGAVAIARNCTERHMSGGSATRQWPH